MPLGDSTDRRIARHLGDLVLIHREEQGTCPHAGRRQRGLAACVAAADNNYVISVFRKWHDHFPTQNS